MDKIPFLDSGVIRGLLLSLISLAGLITRQLGFAFDEAFWNQLADAALLVLATGGAVWAGWARATKPTPPLTEAAAKATSARELDEALRNQGGFARPGALLGLLLMATLGAGVITGCVGTREAYKAADTAEEYAYVVTEHYAALLEQAVKLRANPGVPRDAIAAIQRADLKVAPLILALDPLRRAFAATKTAETETELQLAVDAAVRALAELAREIKAAGSRSTAAWFHHDAVIPQAVLA